MLVHLCQGWVIPRCRILNSILEAQHAQHKAPTLARSTTAPFSSHYFDLVRITSKFKYNLKRIKGKV
eukprot:scaffold149837_cov20-Tisochrysis_lutea.AAC.2